VLASLLIWPLISPGSLVATSYFCPIMTPPHPGDSGTVHRPHHVLHSPPILDQRQFCRFCAPAVHPLAPANSSEPPDIDASSNTNADGPGPPGFGPGFTDGDRVMIPEPPRVEPPHVRPMLRSGEVMAAMLVHRVDPQYPTIAKLAHISGVVHLRAIIGKDGTVRELEVVDGNPLLAQAAKIAVQNWRYQPTRLNGEPVEVETYVTVNFILN
jgi:protein TonB